MSEEKRKLELSETFLHYNTLIWQVPSWGFAIASGVIIAATEVGDKKIVWKKSGNLVQFLILFFGGFLLFALSIALARYRDYQAASVSPNPPEVVFGARNFGIKPRANFWLQGAMSLTTGFLLGLGVSQLFCKPWIIFIGLAIGFLLWMRLEHGRLVVLNDIKNWQREKWNVSNS